ncbi:DUF771 domain-containing protein [Levilactobacillus brevis]|uniref:DUF771 domain-containing protein n=1 Tax=Levilactobacillus brevis TaxID=1580 RepID=UPI000A20752B|nr:DUF771 domain-containing protein [Levilactobacillus brevis]ARN92161.1 DUF771 domain-containing protein [Levilactobacillus brevis]ARN94855.1 DUF771 domain-containing protein [Levilactobacillus brevis]ARW22500.1 hypothetical protein S101174_01665 [Levilactobacillus brevis]QCZ50320.1 prophage P2a protein 12 [Levilactobacillus brevis]RWZ41024.1 DUF771 domain-containing protein [Levilactobacillus brevis]
MVADKIIVSHEAPDGFKLISLTDYEKFQSWEKQQLRIQTWNLSQFARYKFGTKNTSRASNYLYEHADDLAITNGGFIDYEATHNGWRIPVGPMMDYLEEHKEG